MSPIASLYSGSMSLLTDLYQLTMANGYWKTELAHRSAAFHLFFRKNPFQGGYVVTAGLETAVDLLRQFQFSVDDLNYLKTLKAHDGSPLFGDDFLSVLAGLRLSVDIDAMPEGTIAFPHEPILRVTGPILECQLLETALLNVLNFQSLIATKAARICSAAGEDDVLEFGLRRAQGIDGSVSASRAAYIGGCAATSNVLAGKLFGIPVRGTHAHSWVMSFDEELEAFERYAESMPNNCVFLVDTYDTLAGIRNAIKIGLRLRESGHEMLGIRLDSGDLAFLSCEARKLLDDAGFHDTVIVASNDLDEHLIESLRHQGAKISVWGVGTRLATAFDQPALGGVYKLTALQNGTGNWVPKIKLSGQLIKTSTPGIQQVRRFLNDAGAIADMVFDEELGPSESMIDPMDATRQRKFSKDAGYEDLLQPVLRAGHVVNDSESLSVIRNRVKSQLRLFHKGVRRFSNPHSYPVGLESQLHQLKSKLILQARQNPNESIHDVEGD